MQAVGMIDVVDRLSSRLARDQSWDVLADAATILFLISHVLERLLPDALAPAPDLLFGVTAVGVARRDLGWVQQHGEQSPAAETRNRLRMALLNLMAALQMLAADPTRESGVA
jgi:hypothetical protein